MHQVTPGWYFGCTHPFGLSLGSGFQEESVCNVHRRWGNVILVGQSGTVGPCSQMLLPPIGVPGRLGGGSSEKDSRVPFDPIVTVWARGRVMGVGAQTTPGA